MHTVIVWQQFEDNNHNSLNCILVFEGLKESLTVMALWGIRIHVSVDSRCNSPHCFLLSALLYLRRKSHSLCCGFVYVLFDLLP